MNLSNNDPPTQALRRLIGRVKLMPEACHGDVSLHLFGAKERFVLLRRLGVESVWSVHQGRRTDPFLLLEIASLTANRLIALAEALPEAGFTRRHFFELMHSQVEGHREMDATWAARSNGVQSLIAAQRKLDSLEESIPVAAVDVEIGRVRQSIVDCAVYIAFFLEAWWRRHERQ